MKNIRIVQIVSDGKRVIEEEMKNLISKVLCKGCSSIINRDNAIVVVKKSKGNPTGKVVSGLPNYINMEDTWEYFCQECASKKEKKD